MFLSAKHTKKFIFLLLGCILCGLQGRAAAYAAAVIDGYRMEDGFVSLEDETVVHSLNDFSGVYTLVVNKVWEFWVGKHHRFTVTADKREKV